MKGSGACPKCAATDIVRVPGTTFNLTGARSNVIPAGWLGNVAVTRFVCGGCGYSEEWIEDAAALQLLKTKYGSQHAAPGTSSERDSDGG